MVQKVMRRCLQCSKEYVSLSAKAWCCGDPNCYKRWHKARQKLHLSIKEYKDICIQNRKRNNKMKDESFGDRLRARGLTRRGIWLSSEDLRMLKALMQDWHEHQGDLISDLIKAEYERRGGKK